MDFNEQPTNSTPALTAEIAGQVYNLIKQFGDADKAYKLKGDSSIDPEHFSLVDKEIDRIVKELREYKAGKLLEAEEFHYDEEGNKVIDKEAVYYEYTTDADLALQVSSDYLDVETIIEDVLNK
jgi:hypothetical protein